MDRILRICNSVKKKIVPSLRLKQMVRARAEEIRQSVESESRKSKVEAEVRLDGSVAKDTWVRGYEEADIFMRVSPQLTKQQLRNICLPIAKRALSPSKTIERFAEHPYVESAVSFPGGTLRVNVVPCYNVQKGDWHSATDRTPYHTEYVRSHLSEEQHDEVRLLKAFLRGIGGYGADIKTGGFSGMISETLIIARGTFRSALESFVEWNEDRYIDVENYYDGRMNEVRKIFREPLVVIDPVDKGRNLGAAVRASQLWNLVAASRVFSSKPSAAFFFEPKIRPLTRFEFRRQLNTRKSGILCIRLGRIDAVVDILWSQLYRTQRALVGLLESSNFVVMKSASWSDEKAFNALIFELESSTIPATRKHCGPPISKRSESSSFVSKHRENASTVSGPSIENDRWVVIKRRPFTLAKTLLRSVFRSGGAGVGVAPLLIREFKRSAKVYEGSEVAELVSRNSDFGKFMRTFLDGRPVWFAE